MTSEIESRKNLENLYKFFTSYKKGEISLLKFIQFIELIRYFLGPDNELELKIKNTGISRIIDISDFYFFHKGDKLNSLESEIDSQIYQLIIKSINKSRSIFNDKFLTCALHIK